MIACISNTSLIARLIFNYIPKKKTLFQVNFLWENQLRLLSDGQKPTLAFDEIELDFARTPLSPPPPPTLDVSL